MSLIMAMFLVQAGPQAIMARPVAIRPSVATIAPQVRKQRMLVEGRNLLAQAQLKGQHYAPEAGQPSKAELDATIDQMKSDLDSMSEMGEMESLRLQMAMDRLSKLMSTLSNMLKKASETNAAITNNIK